MAIDNLLSRLQKVRKTGKDSWMACCPAHSDKNASLAIKNLDDGRILISCFASCDTYSILSAIGLDWDDVMPESLGEHKPVKQIIYASDALRLIKYETQIILYAAYQIKKNDYTSDDVERLELSMQRIFKAMELSNVE